MAQVSRFDLARLERVERRLEALEDAEAIRTLKARYAALCDRQYHADGIAALLTDATWDSPVWAVRAAGVMSTRHGASTRLGVRPILTA